MNSPLKSIKLKLLLEALMYEKRCVRDSVNILTLRFPLSRLRMEGELR